MRNGEKVKVWNDFWLPMGTLRTIIEGPLNRDEDLITLNHCFDQNHEWLAQCLSFDLPKHILNAIKATPLSCSHEIEDSPNGPFLRTISSP